MQIVYAWIISQDVRLKTISKHGWDWLQSRMVPWARSALNLRYSMSLSALLTLDKTFEIYEKSNVFLVLEGCAEIH